jgi:hypothetical protein
MIQTLSFEVFRLVQILDLLMSKKKSRSDKLRTNTKQCLASLLLRKLKNFDKQQSWFYYKTHREKVAISSWHINEYESLAMWQIFYQKNTEGLAISQQ